MTYKLIEHSINGEGSITRGLGRGFIADPLLIIPENDEIPFPYMDISSIINWDIWGRTLKGYDYGFVRSRIKELYTGDVNNHTEAEKEIILKLNIADVATLVNAFGLQTVLDTATVYHEESKKYRARRIDVASVYIYNVYTEPYAAIILQQLVGSPAGNLINNYVDFGVKGDGQDGFQTVGIMDYIKSGSIFTGAGLAEAGVTPTEESGLTLAELIEDIIDVLTEGVLNGVPIGL